MTPFTIALSDDVLFAGLRAGEPLPADVELVEWDLTGPPPRAEIDLVVLPFDHVHDRLDALAGVRTRLVQSQSNGYNGVAEALPPGVRFANAAGVNDPGTAELALALILAAERALPRYAAAAAAGRWEPGWEGGLADRRALIIGAGGVGGGVAARLAPFEVAVTRVARTARTDDHGRVHALDALPELLPRAEILVLAVPLTEDTRGLIDAAALALLPDGALVVNVARGPVLDTAALLAELASGRLRAALDVTDPEPLPTDHPLWTLPNALITPHVGGNSDAMTRRMVALIRRQMMLLRAGEEPVNVIFG